jgi:hypothetical protein
MANTRAPVAAAVARVVGSIVADEECHQNQCMSGATAYRESDATDLSNRS